jgi:hypothetical protein
VGELAQPAAAGSPKPIAYPSIIIDKQRRKADAVLLPTKISKTTPCKDSLAVAGMSDLAKTF